MDNAIRALVVLTLLGLSVYRIVRYFRHGMARRVAPVAVPSTVLGVMPGPADLTAAQAAATPAATPAAVSGPVPRMRAAAITVAVFLAVNAILWLVLFAIPALAQIPLLWRLFIVIFANFYVLPFAQGVGAKYLKRRQAGAVTAGNPLER